MSSRDKARPRGLVFLPLPRGCQNWRLLCPVPPLRAAPAYKLREMSKKKQAPSWKEGVTLKTGHFEKRVVRRFFPEVLVVGRTLEGPIQKSELVREEPQCPSPPSEGPRGGGSFQSQREGDVERPPGLPASVRCHLWMRSRRPPLPGGWDGVHLEGTEENGAAWVRTVLSK